MEIFKLLLKWGGIPVSAVIWGIGIADDASAAINWGLPLWAWVALGLAVFIFSTSLIIYGAWRENKKLRKELEAEQKNIKEQLSRDLKLMELRAMLRGNKATNIPPTLHSMYSRSKLLTELKKLSTTSEAVLKSIVVELLNLESDDLTKILKYEDLFEKQRIAKAAKQIRKRMGLKKSTSRLDSKWKFRIGKVMDDHDIGLKNFEDDHEYYELSQTLETQRITLSGTKLNQRIDDYIGDMYALNSLRLYMAYSQPHNYKRLLPQEMREFLDLMDSVIERRMHLSLAQVNNALESYQIGEVEPDE